MSLEWRLTGSMPKLCCLSHRGCSGVEAAGDVGDSLGGLPSMASISSCAVSSPMHSRRLLMLVSDGRDAVTRTS